MFAGTFCDETRGEEITWVEFCMCSSITQTGNGERTCCDFFERLQWSWFRRTLPLRLHVLFKSHVKKSFNHMFSLILCNFTQKHALILLVFGQHWLFKDHRVNSITGTRCD